MSPPAIQGVNHESSSAPAHPTSGDRRDPRARRSVPRASTRTYPIPELHHGCADNPRGGVHDFDFLIGSWNVLNRRLKKRFIGNNEWDEFPATSVLETRMGGVVNIDEYFAPARGFSGTTLRVLNQQTRQWAIYWINSRNGVLFRRCSGVSTGSAASSTARTQTTARPSRSASCGPAPELARRDQCAWERLHPPCPQLQTASSRNSSAAGNCDPGRRACCRVCDRLQLLALNAVSRFRDVLALPRPPSRVDIGLEPDEQTVRTPARGA